MSTELTTARILEVTERLMATTDDPDRITAIFGVLCLTLWPGIEP